MRFSLVVCTRGRTEEIADLFASLLRQKRTDFEVLLVDQNDDDRLVDTVARFEADFPLRHIRNTGTGGSRARNVGLDHAKGELIGFPDDDCRYLDGYLDVVNQVFSEDPSIEGITGYPTDNIEQKLGEDWNHGKMDIDSVTVLNRCQEFTTFARRESIGDLRYNECLGVGAQTLWGAEEGPDFLIRLINTGARLVYFPRLMVYHPNKIANFNQATLDRAASYSRGRGCLYRLHPFPVKTVLNNLFRPAMGCVVYLLRFQPWRAAYYYTIFKNILRGLFMSEAELDQVRSAWYTVTTPMEPIVLPRLSSQPLVSVLIANHNYARFLSVALDSLLAQTYTHWEGIVCDDGSTDDSVEVIERYCSGEPRLRAIIQSNRGQIVAFNTCYQEARGEIICLLDADDAFDMQKIEKVVDAFRANPEAGLCNHPSQVIDEIGAPRAETMNTFLDSGWLACTALNRGACVYVPTTSCMSLRREVGDLIAPVTSSQHRDLDGYLAMTAQFLAPFCVIHENLAKYRIHGHNMGGLTEPTPERLRYEIKLIAQRTANVKDFVKQRFGGNLAVRIVMEDNPQYLQAALKMLAIEGLDHRLQKAQALIARHPSATWRVIWHVIFAFPEMVSRKLVPLMHRSHRAKSLVHSLLGREKTVTT